MNLTTTYSLPKKGAKVVVAMSGGVDSSVAAGWLLKMGYQVIGISLQLHDMAKEVENKFGTCCSLTDIGDARRVAETLEIPFYVTDMETEFNESVIENFVDEYLNGRTPNPCVKCNEKVKFSRLMDWAMDLGADYLATGHYAQTRFNPESNLHELVKGADPDKDQSYFLFTMKQEDLARTMFPIGQFEKKQVRQIAKDLNLRVAGKPDSQEICFVQARSYSEFIEQRVPAERLRPGNMLDTAGNVVGQHPGIHHFTIGQRKGLNVPSSEPLYVLDIRGESNEVVVGPESALFRKGCTVAELSWIEPPQLNNALQCTAKIRYRAKETPVEVFPLLDNRVEVRFTDPQRAITPGQALVLYQGDRVLGGGWIEELFS